MTIETPIVIALVAGVFSLVSLLVSLHIARETRKMAAEQIRLSAAARLAEETVGDFKKFAQQIEEFRIECWFLWSKLDRPRLGDGLEVLTEARERYAVAQNTFFTAWAKIKTNVPSAQMEILQVLRHETRHISLSLADTLAVTIHSKQNPEKYHDRLLSMREDLEMLLKHLSTMFFILQTLREDALHSLLTGTNHKEGRPSAAALESQV